MISGPVCSYTRAGRGVRAAGFACAAAGGHLGAAGRAEGTVRGRIGRFRGRSEDVRRYFTVALVALADAPVMPDSSGTPLVDAVSATTAAIGR
ncbi:hypothetical protein [Streptomyces sp. NBC_01262]|uniref:hypothetical protein n=1 Tax=Streptomyces sp. NBC_01262 TaxID=2903803 RepID=UPI002E2F1D6B|nr:hypothetical protein [Streptomyces sp. NBC_01262]